MRRISPLLVVGMLLTLILLGSAQAQDAPKAKQAAGAQAEKKVDPKSKTDKKADNKQKAKPDKGDAKQKAKKADQKKADDKDKKADKGKPEKDKKADKDKPEKEEKRVSNTSKVKPLSKRLAEIFAGSTPKNTADLKAMESHLREVISKVTPCTVGILNGAAGSGVIISPDGYVLTAAHVAMEPGRRVQVIMHDGTFVRGTTLGLNRNVDAGLIKITTKGKWPYVDMGTSTNLKAGQWCLALGHPGGFQRNRRAPVRLGRIISARNNSLQTDCTLVGGDSGGPLFDLGGNVIGIHSRISRSIMSNVHVPVSHYTSDWPKLVKSEIIQRSRRRASSSSAAYLGVTLGTDDGELNKVVSVTGRSAAEKSGIKAGDRIIRFAGRTIRSSKDLKRQLSLRSPGDKIEVEVERAGKKVKLAVMLDKRTN